MESLIEGNLFHETNDEMPEEEVVFDYMRPEHGDYSFTERSESDYMYNHESYDSNRQLQQQDEDPQHDQGHPLAVLPQHEQNAIVEQQQHQQQHHQQEEKLIQGYNAEEKGGEIAAYDDGDLDSALLSPPSTSSKKLDIHNGKYQEFRLSLAVDAAQLGRLTRLNEHVVTAVAEETPKEEKKDWSGVKAAHKLDSKSAFIRVCIEAAAMGRLHRGSEKEYTVTNYDESEEENKNENLDEDANKVAKGMIDEIFETMEETEYQLDEILNELEVLQEVDPGSIEDFMPILDQLKSQVDALRNHLTYQPNSTSTRLDKVIEEQREDISKSWAHHLTVIEDLEKFQDTKDTFDDQNLAVLPCFEEPKFKRPTMFITKGKQRKVIPAQAAKEGLLKMELLASGNDIRIRSTCSCPYCKNPSSFQTQSYKHMRERKQANDTTLKKELVGLARKGKQAKKMVLRKAVSEHGLKPTPTFPRMKYGLSWKSPRTQRRKFREAEARRKMAEQQKALMEQNLPAIGESVEADEKDAENKNMNEKKELTEEARRSKLSLASLGLGAGLMALVSPRSKKMKFMQKSQSVNVIADGDTKPENKSAAERLMDWFSPSTKEKKKVANTRSSNTNEKKQSFVIPALPELNDDDSDDESTQGANEKPKHFIIPGLPSLDDDSDDNEEPTSSATSEFPAQEEEDHQPTEGNTELITKDNVFIPGLPGIPILSGDDGSVWSEEDHQPTDENVELPTTDSTSIPGIPGIPSPLPSDVSISSEEHQRSTDENAENLLLPSDDDGSVWSKGDQEPTDINSELPTNDRASSPGFPLTSADEESLLSEEHQEQQGENRHIESPGPVSMQPNARNMTRWNSVNPQPRDRSDEMQGEVEGFKTIGDAAQQSGDIVSKGIPDSAAPSKKSKNPVRIWMTKRLLR